MKFLFFIFILIACSEPFNLERETIADQNSTHQKANDSNGEEFFYTCVNEKMPQYPGGYKALYRYIDENIQWPNTKVCMEGKVFVAFIVEIDGSLSQIKVVKGLGGKYDEAALKVFQNMSKWESAKQRGQPVKVRMIIPITFCPQEF